MTARLLFEGEVRIPGFLMALRDALLEGSRYFIASTAALAVDAGIYIALIRLADVHYLAAAPAGFALGIVIIYVLSTRWVFRERRLTDSRAEFAIFTAIGLVGLALNEVVIYVGVSDLLLSYEHAKLLSAAVIFGVNFS